MNIQKRHLYILESLHPAQRDSYPICEAHIIDYFERRKKWARKLLAEKNLTSPGSMIENRFEETDYQIIIGPRGGIRITRIADRGHNEK